MEAQQQSESREVDPQPFTQPNLNEITLVPYSELEDGWTLPDEFIAGVYEQTERDGLLPVVFWRDHMNSAEKFAQFCKKNLLVFAFHDGSCVGFAWLTGMSESYAFGHFCFFRYAWGNTTQDAGRKILDYWFSFPGNDGPLFDTIIGMVPDFNKRAHKYVENIGLSRIGEIPNMFRSGDRRAGAVIFYISRFGNGKGK